MGIIWLVTRSYQPLKDDWFKIDFADPFDKERGWLTWGIIGYFATFFAVGVTALATDTITKALSGATGGAVGGAVTTSGGGTIDGVVPLIGDMNNFGFFSILAVTSVLAPLLEEVRLGAIFF